MILFGLEIIGFAMLFYGMKELLSYKNTSDVRRNNRIIITSNNYQPPPRYEEINERDNNNNISTENPPSYSEQ